MRGSFSDYGLLAVNVAENVAEKQGVAL
jgi:hypothetical protein